MICFIHRSSLSQFLVLPPFQKQGHGSKLMIVMSLLELLTDGYGMLGELYKTLYQILMTRSEIKEITGRLMGIGDGVVVDH